MPSNPRTEFRLLDLGAHDGFVTNFIGRQAKAAGRKLRIDGVEANPEGVRLFNERMKRDGIPGECVQDLAENAITHFKARSYDAVVAFELLEHARHPESFLQWAEAMCKPEGRVYISTPNGTFGAGNNPHHLHCWSMVDLFDMLRHRGIICDALPGPDGVSVISYRPHWKYHPEVAVYCGPGWEKWSPNDIEHKGLGGSETAAVRVADKLAEQYDCCVTVYGEVDPGAVGQVVYRHYGAFDPTEPRHLVICSRLPELFDRKINADAAILWMHDTDCADRLTEQRAERMNKVMVLSKWHRDHVASFYPFLEDKLYVTRNGIEPSYFTGEAPERNPHRAVFTSSPDRGLDLLLGLWPDVRARVPDAELHYCYASVYDAVAARDPRIAQFRERIRSLADQPGVVDEGSQTQPGVAALMRASGVWLAPSYSTPASTPFHETFCIGAVEAAAAGCRRVVSEWGALTERDEGEQDWRIASGDSWRENFVDAIVEAMELSAPHEPSRKALEMTWDEVAADMLAAAADSQDQRCLTPQSSTLQAV